MAAASDLEQRLPLMGQSRRSPPLGGGAAGAARRDVAIRVACVVGMALSLYALYVEQQVLANPDFEAACDMESLGFSCSKVFTSPWGHMFFNLPNALFGCVFYLGTFCSTLAPFQVVPHVRLITLLAVVFSAGFSVFLAYVLMYKLGDVCIVCITTYFVNFFLLYTTYRVWKQTSRPRPKSP